MYPIGWGPHDAFPDGGAPAITCGIQGHFVPLSMPSPPTVERNRVPMGLLTRHVAPRLVSLLKDEIGVDIEENSGLGFGFCEFFVMPKVLDGTPLIQVIWNKRPPLPVGVGRRFEAGGGIYRLEHWHCNDIDDDLVEGAVATSKGFLGLARMAGGGKRPDFYRGGSGRSSFFFDDNDGDDWWD